jgi:hypothetical protein
MNLKTVSGRLMGMAMLGFLVAQFGLAERREAKPGAERALSGVRMPFIANSGQTDPNVVYYAPTFAATVFVTRDGGIVYSLLGAEGGARRGWSLTERAVAGKASPKGMGRASAQVSYFIGNDPARWKTSSTVDAVSLGEVWPGISLDLQARGGNVEKIFTVAPGAHPSRIRMGLAGALRMRAERDGSLVASTGLGDVVFTAPVAYQQRGGERAPVRASYVVRGRQYGFRLGGYDPSLPVVIDPLIQATYLGGSADEQSLQTVAMAIHPVSGDVYVAGHTESVDFPGTSGGAQPAKKDMNDAFVARINATLTSLRQASYFGGSGDDVGLAAAIHPVTGEVYVAGRTNSDDLPNTAGGAVPARVGSDDVFVARFNAALTTVKQTTYAGGTSTETPWELAVHPASGDVYVAGQTESADFVGRTGGAQASYGGGRDGFISRLNSGLTALSQTTYIGGSAQDWVHALAIHPATGDVYAGGPTVSTDLPGRLGGAYPSKAGDYDAFVSRFNAALTALSQSTYLGGSASDAAYGIAVHPASGDVYVGGETSSTDFPGIAGGGQTANAGAPDLFVARLNPALTSLSQASYFGGSFADFRFAIAVHPASGDVYLAGATVSGDLPGRAGGAQPAGGGDYDGFVTRLNAGLTSIRQTTYLGGSASDSAGALAVHPFTGQLYVAGWEASSNFPATAGGAQPQYGGGFDDAYVARLTPDLAASSSLTAFGPAKIWFGLKNSDDIGLRLDILAEVFVNLTKIGQGQLNNVSAGGSGFPSAILDTVPLSLTGGPAAVASGDAVKLKISARRSCSGVGHNSGTARLWYNGQPIDTGVSRDAGTRFSAVIGGSTLTFFDRGSFQLSETAGSSKLSIDKFVDSKATCGSRPFTEFGTWSVALP